MGPEVDAGTRAWRGIDELAGLVGVYCWVENRIFEVSGAWATEAGGDSEGGDPDGVLDSALRVWCAGVSRRHGLLAARWAERLPVRAGVDGAALVTAPAGPLAGALGAMAATPDARVGVETLVQSVFPRLRAIYGLHRRTASPVSEGSVLEVLAVAQQDFTAEINTGRALLQGAPEGLTRDAELGPQIERAFAETSVFPAVPAS
ncbi:MAG TPA: hypothetical protein VIJ56_08725 [Acidimicrobiales bacterium]